MTTPLGFGLGLRPQHYEALLGEHRGSVSWLEALTDNYLVPGGRPLHYLERLRQHYPVVLHGVSLSIGSTDPLDLDYVRSVKALADRIEPAWISDHLCWTGVGAARLHDLLPVPFTEEALDHVARRVHAVQEALRRELVLENVSSYVAWPGGAMTEWDFIAGLVARTGCGVLLDVNNVYVSAVNHGFDPHEYLAAVPAAAVRQIHLAGHTIQGTKLVDTHDAAVRDEVWSLYEEAIALLGPRPTMIERDGNIPPLAELLDELDIARRLARRALDGGSGHALAA